MDNLDDPETVVKISDSAYSNSCSNSQSRRSHSSKSTHSGSHSSGSSGYGGKPSTSNFSNSPNQPSEKRTKEKDGKKKKTFELATEVLKEQDSLEPTAEIESPKELIQATIQVDKSPMPLMQAEERQECMDIVSPLERNLSPDELNSCNGQLAKTSVNFAISRLTSKSNDGFSFVISLHDGVIMFSTATLTSTLGFPMDMWIGRSFIDFVHPRDRSSFSTEITNGFGIKKYADGTPARALGPSLSIMLCRLRVYKGLSDGFDIREPSPAYMAFHLKLSFKHIIDAEENMTYVVVHATPFISAFKSPNESVKKPIPFVLRHSANGHLDYIDPESVPYLGYLPHDLLDKDALELYHPDDLTYLKQIYEQIVKEGGATRSKTYRMLAQNGEYLKLESEWSSFINPWSRKLEFIIGKHHIIEGPSNPDVFQSPDDAKPPILDEEEMKKWKSLMKSMINIMNEVLTKPAEAAKQRMTKRCHDLTSFMDGLIEDSETNNRDEELRLEIQDIDNCYYERDSVMLGGISPHHEYSESNSGMDTPLSYNQLNYNENLQRYFDSHDPNSFEDYWAIPSPMGSPKPQRGNCLSLMAQNSKNSSIPMNSNNGPASPRDFQLIKLTETLLSKHNTEMERDLVKKHRETREHKGDREKTSESRQKKKEHLARCNASYQPAMVAVEPKLSASQSHGVKRHAKPVKEETETPHKIHCSSQRQTSRKTTENNATEMNSPTGTTTVGPTPWQSTPMNTYLLGFQPQQMSMMSPVAGVVPMYYVPNSVPIQTTSTATNQGQNSASMPSGPSAHYVLCGHVYGTPMMYSPVSAHMTHPMHYNHESPSTSRQSTTNPLGLASSIYEEACKTTIPPRPKKCGSLRKPRLGLEALRSGFSSGSVTERKTSRIPGSSDSKSNSMQRATNSENVDETDESSYSSFYSSFFKTDSNSAEESSDPKKNYEDSLDKVMPKFFGRAKQPKMLRRKMDPPWLEKVCMTSEIIYKYQIQSKSMDEILVADKEKFSTLEQSTLVNDQLSQLYMDLQLEGRATRLTLEEGITSSSSSGEESSVSTCPKGPRRKREYSSLGMIYEENAPLPPPAESSEEATNSPQPSTSKDNDASTNLKQLKTDA